MARPGDGHAIRGPVSDASGRAQWMTLTLLGLVALAVALRALTLDAQSFSDDELFTLWLVRMPFQHMLSTIPHSEATPPLFYVLEWISVRVFGSGEVGMRVLPATAGILTVGVIYAIGAVACGRRVALAATAFAASDPFLIWYSQEARAYALMILFVALSLLGLIGYARKHESSWLIGWALASAAALASHYFALFIVLPEAVWLLLVRDRPRRERLLALSVPLLVGAGLLPLALHQRSTVSDPGGVKGMPLWHRLAAVPKNFLVGFSIPLETIMVILATTAAAVALVVAWRRPQGASHWLAVRSGGLVLCGVGLPLLLVPFGLDYMSSRNVIAALVPTALLLGCGFGASRLGAAALAGFVVISIVTLIGVSLDTAYQRPDWRGLRAALGPARVSRALVFNPPFHNPGPFRTYFGANAGLMTHPTTIAAEVDVVALDLTNGFGPRRPAPPAGPAAPAPPGFHLTENVTTRGYRLIRYVAATPRRVGFFALAALALPHTPAVAVLQTPVDRRP